MGDSPQCGEMSRSDRGDRRRQRVDFCVAKRRRGCNYAGCNSARQLNYIFFYFVAHAATGTPFLVWRKERAERFAFKGGFRFPL